MKSLRIVTFMACLCCACPMPVFAASASETPTVVAKLSRESVQVAEPLSLDLTVTARSGSKVTFPATGKTLGKFEVLETSDDFDIPSAQSSKLRTWVRRMQLESIATGDLEIPAIEIRIVRDGETKTIRSQPLKIHVSSVLEDRSDPTKFRDIESVVDLAIPPVKSRSVVWWTVGGFTFMALALAIGMVLSRREKWITPNQWATEKLDQLERAMEVRSVQSDDAITELSDIVREFLVLQFDMAESGRTGQELLSDLQSQKRIEQTSIKQFGDLFMLADMSKFAGLRLSKVGIQSAIKDVRRLIRSTW